MTRVHATFEGSVKMASYILLVQRALGKVTGEGTPVSIVEIIHERNWSSAELNHFAKGFPDLSIKQGEKILIDCSPPANLPNGEPWIVLISSIHPERGIFNCDLDWPAVPKGKMQAIISLLSKDR